MCGIAGFVLKNKDKNADIETIRTMTDSIKHRGPDSEGHYLYENIALGHRRLSIIDISDNGKQPLFSYDGNYIIIFNGEIYNYIELRSELVKKGAHFKTNTDTEIIMEAYRYWGENCVQKFNGMWAFCIYDRIKKCLFLSRDRFGVKPLYYVNEMDYFVFGSEIKAILSAFPREAVINNDVIYKYLTVSTIEDNSHMTFYKNIYCFPQANNMRYDIESNTITLYEYWKADYYQFSDKWINGNDPNEVFSTLFESAVKLRLRSDVEVGICLSGGIDSSAITGVCSKKYNVYPRTFSSRYTGTYCDETMYIDAVNRFAGTEPFPIYPENNQENLIQEYEKIIYANDAPNYSGEYYSPYYVYKNIKGNVKVVLDGQGADEAFAGYINYYANIMNDIMLEKHPFFKSIKLIGAVSISNPSALGYLYADKALKVLSPGLFVRLSKMDLSAKSLELQGNKRFTDEFISSVNMDDVNSPKRFLTDFYSPYDLNNTLHADLIFHSLPHILSEHDRYSMWSSIESRSPFMDYRLMEFSIALDGKYKIKNDCTKVIVRKNCKKYLPKEVYYRKGKMGFPAPFSEWLRTGGLKEEMKSIIYSFSGRGIIKKEAVDYFYKEHINNIADNNIILYRIMACELWMRRLKQFIQ